MLLALVFVLSLVSPGIPATAANLPANCAEVKASNPSAGDGEYTIYAGGKVLNVYCHDMSGSPREYISLPRNGGTYNKSQFLSWGGGSITTWYTKLRFNPANLTADSEDYIFATSQVTPGTITPIWFPAGHVPYANGSGCDGRIGEGNVDLTGTPFAISRPSMETLGGWYGIDWSSNDQILRPWGGGWCGHAVPASRWIQLNWLGPSISPALSPAPNATGWNHTNVNVSFNCGAGVWAVSECTPGTAFTAEGAGQQTTGYVKDAAGWSAYAATPAVSIDKTPPAVSASLSGPTGGGGKYTGPVTVNIASADTGGSGLLATHYSVDGAAAVPGNSVVVSQEGAHTVSYFALDYASNWSVTGQVQFEIVGPMPSPPPAVSYRGQFDGLHNGAYVEIPDHPDLRLTTALTLEGWVSWNGTNGYRVFLSKPSAAMTSGYHLVLWDGKPMLQIGAPGEWRETRSPTALPPNQWTHIAGTYDGRWSRLYVNGVEAAARDYGTFKALSDSTGPLLIGREFTTPGFLTERTFGGALDNIRVWNAALSPATIAAWQGQTDLSGHPNVSSLRGFWRFDEGSGSVTADNSNRGHTGILHGAAWSPLTINAPAEVTATATGPEGAAVTYSVSAADPVDGLPLLTCTPASGSVFPLGTNPVTCSATDRPGNTFTKSFPVMVYENTPPTTTASVTPPANAFGWHNGTATVLLAATDTGSGVKEITYSATGAGALPEASVAGSAASVSVSAEGTTLLSFRATDNANNAENPQSLEIRNDVTPPVISGAATAEPSASGWYQGDVTIHWTVSDTLSGIDAAPADSVITGEGNDLGASATVSDKAGNSATAVVNGIKIDRANPVVTAARTPANGYGWNNSAVTITFTCSDALSGVASCTPPVTLDLQGPDQRVTGTAVDSAGNSASLTVTAVNIDLTAPVISASRTPTANRYGWNNSDVTVSFTCTDDLSGVASCSSPITLSGEGAGQSAPGTVTDKAGTSASATLGGVNIDKTPPVVTFSGNAGTYTVDQVVNITCTSSDSLSGLAGDTCVSITGPAYSFSIGVNSYAATATDQAGNVGNGSTSFTVSNTYGSLCSLSGQFSTKADVTQGLCDKLAAAQASEARGNTKTKENQIKAFINLVEAQTGKALTPSQAAILIGLARLF